MSKLREILYEMRQVGNAIKVTAIDPATGVEVSIVGSSNTSEFSLKENAKRKLEYVLKKRQA